MYISNNSGMATLLQQKNCMKTLTNGGVSSSTNGNNSSAGVSAATAATGTGTAIHANGATNTLVTHNHHLHHHHSGVGNTGQQSRILKPHEMVSIPIGSLVTAIGTGTTGNGVSSATTQGAFVVTGYQTTTTLHNNHHSQSLNDLHSFSSSSHHHNNTMFSHNNQQQQYNAAAATTTTTASGTTPTRYFSQFGNDHLNNSLYSSASTTTSSCGTNTANRMVVTSTNHMTSSPALNHNLNAHTIVKQEPMPPSSSANNHQIGQHRQNLQHLQQQHHSIKTESTESSVDRVNGGGCKQSQNTLQNGTVVATSTTETITAAAEEQEPEPEIDIVINNVVCSFSVRCHLNLRDIALHGFNVEFRRENGMVTMKLRRPYTTASIWSSGRITCTGATSEDQAKIAARRYARCLQKLGFRVRFHNFRVVNVLGTCSMPWAIKIVNFSERYKKEASYEPELHPGVTYKLRHPKATLKIFSTGSITVTAASVANVQAAIEHIFPLVYEFRKKRTPEEMEQLRLKQQQHIIDLDETEVHSSLLAKRKRRKLNEHGGEADDIDDPEMPDAKLIASTATGAGAVATDDIIMVSEEFDDPNDLIEGPEDEDNYVL